MEQALQNICGEKRATTDPFELAPYAQDVAYVPAILVNLLTNPLPKAVVQPISAEEISRLIKWARQSKMPVTVRGGGSTAYFNSVPLRSGLVIDTNRLQGFSEIELDQVSQKKMVWVKAGMTWKDLDDRLGLQGCAVCSSPSSAPSATIGGWVSMGGLGIGSVPYGSVHEQVMAIRGVTAAGEIFELSRPDQGPARNKESEQSGLQFNDLLGTEGTRGVITEIKLLVRDLPEKEEHLLAVFNNETDTGAMMSWLGGEQFPSLYNVHFSSPEFIMTLQKAGYAQEIPPGKFSLEIDLEGNRDEVDQAVAQIIKQVKVFGGSLLPDEVGAKEWADRFKSLRLEQTLPSLLAAEMTLPVRNFEAFYKSLSKLGQKTNTLCVTYAHLVSPEMALVMVLYPSDELSLIRYIVDLSFTSKLYKLGHSLGGKPYVIGFWNTPYLGKIYDKEERERRCRRKQAVDPQAILNPGKGYNPPSIILNSYVFGLGMIMLGLLRPLVLKILKGGEGQ
ncbi:FAD/FMN-dependent dehydrogenase [Desulfosporosinus orientis DSM 765]|uniref:D-lactate dehydrogenase (cytochrome) n=1 Tax=Desulfosporosinus orientis (strain ATCC 19365 / DSM 765 / NCIMB 8382 / VKM B-1628 / Singapore I) TaxID=768706 RepID=G7WJ97_DESOD|nr:FAD-binding oxidoreductase [Desulfosporosinus orientis]AET69756.1 FAD/FMN-dependent dehydrogenase [Desulfosporosinus orientis DSM 765]